MLVRFASLTFALGRMGKRETTVFGVQKTRKLSLLVKLALEGLMGWDITIGATYLKAALLH